MITRIYTTDYVVIDYDPSVPCLLSTNLKFMYVEEIQTHLNFALEYMREKVRETGRILWLVDARLSPVFNEDGVRWCIEDWTPRAVQAGIKHVAFVLPHDELAKMGIDDYSDGAGNSEMTVAYFGDIDSAKRWFTSL